MIKRIVSILLLFAMCLGVFPIATSANEAEAFELYQEAVQNIIDTGSWIEDLAMTADMTVSNGSAKTKTKFTVNSLMDISGYSENDLSDLQMSGSVNMNVMNQSYAWDIQYKNGIAHYEYTEPNQTSVDIEMDPDYFNFNILTQDMLEDAKISGNQISFKILGNKMERTGIAAVNLMDGIDNLHYGDVDVEVTINKSTGMIDTIVMAFHASLTYQGYGAEVDYVINYQFLSQTNSNPALDSKVTGDVIGEIENGLIVYSDYTSLSIRKDSIITLSAGVIIDGEQVHDISGITFWTEDDSVLDVNDTKIQDNLRCVEFRGLNKGTTIVVFTDSETGYIAKIPVTVYEDNYLSYTLNSVPIQYIEKYPTNFYNVNGLYVDNYSYTVNDDMYAEVFFDVYNTNYTYGVVEVIEADGTVVGAVLIEKMGSSNTSIKEALWDNTGYLIRDLIDGDLFSYRQESGYSKKTSVSVKIPPNGYIKICNDPENSFIVNMVNSADILMSLSSLAGEIKNFDVNSKVFSEKLTVKLIEEKIYAELIKDGSDMPEKLWKNVSKEVFFSSESLGNFSDTIAKNIDNLELGDIIAETAGEVGWGIGEKVFEYFSGPIGIALKGMFTFGKAENIIIQHNDLIKASNVGSIYIQNQGGGIRSSQQITVESGTGFSDDTSLNVFKVTFEPDKLNALQNTNPDVYDIVTNGTSHTYNISLLESGEEIQPDGEATVHIPIPEDMKLFAYAGKAKIYRVEENGMLTEMDVDIEDNCFVFNTTHFSLYTLVGDSALSFSTVISLGAVLVAGIVVLAVIIKKRIRKKAEMRVKQGNKH